MICSGAPLVIEIAPDPSVQPTTTPIWLVLEVRESPPVLWPPSLPTVMVPALWVIGPT